MMMEPGKTQAMRELRHFGFLVEEIPEATEPNQKRADLLARDENACYIIEVKDKEESLRRVEERRVGLATGEVRTDEDPMARDNTISGVLLDARDQLDATPKGPNTFQLIWFYATGLDADTKYRQAMYTFYGLHHLVNRSQPGNIATDCFYFDYCAAFNMPTVEAMILTDKNNLQVCVNEFSHRSAEFRQSEFFRRLKEVDGVFDPVGLVETGQFIAFRSSMPRKNEDAILAALNVETGQRYTAINMNRYTYSVVVESKNP